MIRRSISTALSSLSIGSRLSTSTVDKIPDCMLRRPFPTVLSSLSIGSRISTRLFCAPPTSTNDQIPTVRTSGSKWAKDNVKSTKNIIYWGKGDPRNRKLENENDGMDKEGTRLRSLLIALEQAQKDGLKKIRVQTDLAMDATRIRRVASIIKKNSDSISEKKYLHSKLMYCERILKIMANIEVIFDHRSDSKPVVTFPDSAMSLNDTPVDGKTSPRAYSGCTVKTTGYGWKKDEYQCTLNGVYWGKGDPRNVEAERRNDTTDITGIMLRAILVALEQAMKSGLKQIRVQTDSDISERAIRKLADRFKNEDLTTMKDIHLAQFGYSDRIVKIMDEIEVFLEYVPPWNGSSAVRNNEVKNLLQREKGGNSLAETVEFTPTGVPSMENRIVPTVYTEGGHEVGTSVWLWVPESVEHLEINQRPLGSVQRLSIDPRTYLRAQMLAILNAIKEAHALNIPEIQVVTYSLLFVDSLSRNWKTTKGQSVHNEELYLKIKALTDTIKVHFKGVKVTTACDDKLLMKVFEMAHEGAGIPVNNVKNMKKYETKKYK